MLWLLWTLFVFLESASRGSSWQRWPILRLIHRVHGLSCIVSVHLWLLKVSKVLPLGTRVQQLRLKYPGTVSEEAARKAQDHTYKIASHVL